MKTREFLNIITDYKLANEIRKFVDVLKGSSKLIKKPFNGCWKRLIGLILQSQSRMNYLEQENISKLMKKEEFIGKKGEKSA
ncbi:hypothetical protein [Bacillus pumilus]|uniref:hypothetical protein n=1 Tax=Bacillus TaxID=1386 RepID=UPI001657CD61|nr:hypothetical protein [Bacillus pumilus]QNP17042.1 hypothetical protein H9S87_03255 [Bacillus pumilus]